MPGIGMLRKTQIGKEVTAGTLVAATAIWRGDAGIKDARELTFVDERVGYLGGVDRSYVAKLYAEMAMKETPATFEQILYLLESGVKVVNTGAADGTGSDKVYAYTLPTTALNTLKTFTFECGDNQQAEVMEYGFVKDFTLTGRGGEAVMMAANWGGRQAAPQAFTGALTLPTVEEILFSKGALYIDAVTGSYGSTAKSSTLLAMSLKYNSGITPVWSADGQLYFTFTKMTKPEVVLDITFEHDATSVAEKAAFRAQTARLIRLDFAGNAVTTAGTSYSTKKLQIDLAGKWETFDQIDEQDGNDIVTGTFRSRYNGTKADWGTFRVVNELASLT